MTDRKDSSQDRPTPPSPEWAAEQWSVLCDVLNTNDPQDVVPRVRTLKERMDDLDQGPRAPEGLVTISEVEEVFQEMHEKLQTLRERNAELVEQLNDDDASGVQSAFKELHAKTEDLLESLGVTSLDDAQERVKSLNRQLDSLYEEKEILIEAGITGARDALDEIDDLREARDQLKEENEALKEAQTESGPSSDELEALREERNQARSELERVRDDRNRLQSERDDLTDRIDSLESDVDAVRTKRNEVQNERDELQMERNRLQSEREDLKASLDEMQSTLDAVKAERDRAVSERNDLQETHQALQEAHDQLQQKHDELQAKAETLQDTVDAQQDVQQAAEQLERENQKLTEAQDELQAKVETLQEKVDDLQTENESLRNENDQLHAHTEQLEKKTRSLSDEAQKLENARAQLKEENEKLRDEVAEFQTQAMDVETTAAMESAEGIRKVLGIETEDQARALANAVRQMQDRLQRLADVNDRLASETGVEDPSDVLTMIESMEAQLAEFYRQKDEGQKEQGASTASDRPDGTEAHIPEEVADVLGVSTTDEARELATIVRRMSERLQSLDAETSRLSEAAGVHSAEDALAMIRSMEAQLEDLYSERELSAMSSDAPSSTPQLNMESSGEGVIVDDDTGRRMIPAEVGEVLGVTTVDEAEELGELVRNMTQQLERLSDEQEKLEEAGLTVENALTMIETMEEQLIDLYQSQESAQPDDVDRGANDGSGDDSGDSPAARTPQDLLPSDTNLDLDLPEPSTPDDAPERGMTDAASVRISELLGVQTEEQAEELNALVRSMAQRLKELGQQHEKLMDLGMSVENTVTMIESLEEQLVDLYQDREKEEQTLNETSVMRELDELKAVLGISSPEEARELEAMVRGMGQELQKLVQEKNSLLNRTGLGTVDNVVAMVDSMEQQLVDLYEAQESAQEAAAATEANSDAAEQLHAIEDVLGISTRSEAEQLADIARSMENQLDDLYDEKEKLEAIGLTSIEDAVNMVQSMEQQLTELYEDKETVQDFSATSLGQDQDTFQQLQALYAEQEKLKRELGVADAEEIIEMVEGLATQLEEMYQDRDFDAGGTGALDSVPDGLTSASGDGAASADGAEVASADVDLMLSSMQQQLEVLYDEKEALLEQGIGDAREALARIDQLREKVESLRRQNEDYKRKLSRLQSEFGTDRVTRVIQVARNLRSNIERPEKDVSAGSGTSQSTKETGFVINAAPALMDESVLERLETMSSSELDALDVGAVRLNDRGKVEYVNEAGLKLPGLDDTSDRTTITGKNFFFELAPSTNNNLFFGRFKQGIKQGAMNARFPYTFISPGRGPQVLIVHLHRKPDENANWILFRPM